MNFFWETLFLETSIRFVCTHAKYHRPKRIQIGDSESMPGGRFRRATIPLAERRQGQGQRTVGSSRILLQHRGFVIWVSKNLYRYDWIWCTFWYPNYPRIVHKPWIWSSRSSNHPTRRSIIEFHGAGSGPPRPSCGEANEVILAQDGSNIADMGGFMCVKPWIYLVKL